MDELLYLHELHYREIVDGQISILKPEDPGLLVGTTHPIFEIQQLFNDQVLILRTLIHV